LITPNVVLTAAHCIQDIKSAQIGRYDFEAEESGAETYTDLERRMHPGFDPDTYDMDYALVKLERSQPAPFLISLRRTPEIPDELAIMGWGLTADGGEQSSMLLDATVVRLNDEVCKADYDPEPVTENMFCASEDGIDSCQGDSGGPIISPGTNIQVGIVSWGNGCGNATYPGVYARVDKGYSWIEETVCKELSPTDCTEGGKLPLVDERGAILEQTCEDRTSFRGLGKKLLSRNCTWVKENRERRCPWYGEDYCPSTCRIQRCLQ
jgi:trypsin